MVPANSRLLRARRGPSPEPADAARLLDCYSQRVDKPWGWELHWTPSGLSYLGKLLHIREGHRLSLQAHDLKSESWFVVAGRVMVIWDDEYGNLRETELELGKGYTCARGRRHRLVAITDCEIVEVSTPEVGTTWRFEDDYGRPHETPEQRRRERHEAR